MKTKKPRLKPPRVIVAIDINCFYAQVEILKQPELENKAVGVFQKHLVVTTNYVARKLGAPKMVPIQVAKKACPNIILIDGSDLAPYRKASAGWVGSLRNWATTEGKFESGVKLQKQGLDEVFVDISEHVHNKIQSHEYELSFKGHVVGNEDDNVVRQYLMVGSQVAEELRKVIYRECKLTTCGGIGVSKLAAKLAVDMHKPNDQTTLLSTGATSHIFTLPVRKVPGFGPNYHERLKAFDVQGKLITAGDVLARFETNQKDLETVMGNKRAAASFLDACRGVDLSDVKESGAPVIITSEDSFLSSTAITDVRRRLHYQVIEMLERLQADCIEHRRSAKTMTVKFRRRFRAPEEGFGYITRAIPMPMEAHGGSLRLNNSSKFERAVEVVLHAAMAVLRTHGGISEDKPFDLSLVGVGATNFTTEAQSEGIAKYFCKGKEDDKASVDRQVLSGHVPKGVLSLHSASTSVSCPVCDMHLPSNTGNASLNRHIDSCLSKSHSSMKKQSKLLSFSSIKKSRSKDRKERGAFGAYFRRPEKRSNHGRTCK